VFFKVLPNGDQIPSRYHHPDHGYDGKKGMAR
jgi:hypothetical protein